MAKAVEQHLAGCRIVCLVPARTDTAWWHDYVMPYASDIRFIRGRLKFNDGPNAAPFPSAIVVYGN
jgi:site-specific DNA-methyltransferase (adenine-specific)